MTLDPRQVQRLRIRLLGSRIEDYDVAGQKVERACRLGLITDEEKKALITSLRDDLTKDL